MALEGEDPWPGEASSGVADIGEVGSGVTDGGIAWHCSNRPGLGEGLGVRGRARFSLQLSVAISHRSAPRSH